ncbi:hypothetical protein, partial [Thiolapillus sp.]|uniref:hypothetical protein n=1 Tax=Thiolapillus sp. TaxID=2017437 RepID=UPI003AF4CA14
KALIAAGAMEAASDIGAVSIETFFQVANEPSRSDEDLFSAAPSSVGVVPTEIGTPESHAPLADALTAVEEDRPVVSGGDLGAIVSDT